MNNMNRILFRVKPALPLVLALITLILLPVSNINADEKALPFDKAIEDSVKYLFDHLPDGSKVAVYDFTIPPNAKPALSDYLVDEITRLFSRERPRFITVNRQEMDAVKKEMNLHLSGEVSDETAKAIGKKTGADIIITGTVMHVGSVYRLTLKPISVEREEFYPVASANIKGNDRKLGFFIDTGSASRFHLLAGARAGISLHLWKLSDDITGKSENPSFGFEPALQGVFYFNNFIGLQTEAALSMDSYSYSGDDPSAFTASFESLSLRLPLLLRLTYRPGIFALSAFGGVSFNIPLGKMTVKSSLYDDASYRISMPPSYVAGANVGLRLGPGFMFTDIRFSGDFAKNAIHDSHGTLAVYKRNTLSISMGYEYEFF